MVSLELLQTQNSASVGGIRAIAPAALGQR